ncbi:MAG: thioredoxin domain-containing protein [Deltaproteobacteria bacterium]|jgi:protein-disulfide isomerase/uncharacterized membrane protein|nr:thioredoxin domain-containing protein [Deltaproteobacteria bacterium]
MRKWALIIALIVAFCGVTLSVISSTQYFRIQQGGLEKQSFCAINDTFNCDIVTASSYAKLFGVPNAWLGVLFYGAAALLIIFVIASKKQRKSTRTFLWFMSLWGLLFSIYLAYASFFIVGALCILCIGMYAVNILLFVLLFVSSPIPVRGFFGFLSDYIKGVFGKKTKLGGNTHILSHLAFIAAVFFIGLLIYSNVNAKYKKMKGNQDVDQLVKYHSMQSLHDIEVDPEWAMWGNPNAKVTLVEFSEYQCPFCRIAAFNIKPFLYEYKDDIKYYFVDFPLDNSCNLEMSRQMHPVACFAARAAQCAGRKDAFWSFHDEMFRNQKKLSEDFIVGLAKDRGWDVDEFKGCIDSPEIKELVSGELKAGRKAGVSGTPSLFIDGKKLKYWRNPDVLRAVVKEEIKRKGK